MRYAVFFVFIFFVNITRIFSQGAPACPNITPIATPAAICAGSCSNLTATVIGNNQTTNYTVASIPHSPYAYSGGTAVSVGTDDVWGPIVTLPFNFCFYGVNHSTVKIGSNGQIMFSPASANGYDAYPVTNAGALPSTANTPGNTINVFRDIDPSISSTGPVIKYYSGGTAPCRYFVVYFKTVGLYSCTTPASTFQMVIYETTNFIDIYIGNSSGSCGWQGGRGIVGIQNANATLACVAPGRNANSGNWTATNEAWRFSPSGAPSYTVTWKDPSNTIIGTGLGPINVCPTATTTYNAKLDITNCDGTVTSFQNNTTVTVNPSPTVTVNSGTYCSGGSVTLTASGATTYTWSPPTGLSATTGASVSANPTVTTNYTVTGTTAGCTNTAISTVTVTNGTGTAGSNSPVCTGNSLNLTALAGASYSWTGPNGFTSTQQNPTISNVTALAAGTYTVTTGGSCPYTASTTVVINTGSVVSATVNSPCVGGTLNFTGGPAGMTSYNWTGPNSFSIQNPTKTNVTAADAGIYTLTITNSNGCQNTTTVTATVNALPVATATANAPCAGQTLTLTGGPAGMSSYVWTGTNTGNTQNLTIASASAANNGTSTLTVTNSNGCQGTANITIAVNPVPVATAVANSPCAGQALTLTGGPAGMSSYVWTGTNTGNTQNLTIASASAANNGSSTLTVTDANGCQGSANVTVALSPSPVATVSTNTPCEGQTLTLTGGPAGMSSYVWTGTNTGNTQNLTISSASSANNGTSILTVTNSSGCQNSASLTITVNPLPIATASANTPCAGQTLNITGGPAGMSSYLWTGSNPGSTQNLSIAGSATLNSGTNTLTVTDANGCQGTASVNVTVNPLPVASAGANTPCVGQALNISGGPAGMSSYNWTGVNTGTTQNINIASAALNNAGLCTLNVTDGNGCQGSANVNITVNTLPIATASANSPCAGQTLTLAGGPAGMSSYVWTGTNTGNTQDLVIASASTANNGSNTLTVTDANGCQSAVNLNVSVSPSPTADAGINSSVCAGGSASLTGTGAGSGGTYNWNWISGGTISNATTASITDIPLINTWYFLTVTNSNGCSNTDSVKIRVNPLPVVNFSVAPVCAGNSSAFINTSADTSYAGPLTCFWNYGDAASSTSTNCNPTFTYPVCGNPTVTLIETSVNGCVAVLSKPITINCNPVAAFSSNNICFPGTTAFNNTSNISNSSYLSYSWDFDFISSTHTNDDTTQNPSHQYNAGTYTVELTAMTGPGCSNSVTQTVTTYPKPIADFNTNNVCLNQTTLFTNASIIASPDNLISWSWDFDNDGVSNASGQGGISNVYTSPNAVNASLTVTSNNGCTDNIIKAVNIYPLPVAAFTVAPVCLGATSQFINSSSVSAGSISNNDWIFDTATGSPTSSIAAPYNTYTTAGSFPVQLKVTTTFGCVDSVVFNAIVNPNPVVDFMADLTSGCAPLCINLSELSTVSQIPPGSVNSIFNWSFGDGNSGSGSSQSHCYENSGSYNAGLTVTSNFGCSTTLVKPAYITVYPNPVANFTSNPTITNILDPHFSLTDLSQGAYFINWNFGDKDTLSSAPNFENINHTYADTGTYIITQIVTSQFGCIDSIKIQVRVGPEFMFFIPNTFSPNGDKVNDLFNGKGIGIVKYELLIFNRWGNLINRIESLSGGWDGSTFTSDEICQTDIYLWEVRLTDVFNQPHKYMGSVNLLK